MIGVVSVKEEKPPVVFNPIEITLKIENIDDLKAFKKAIGTTMHPVGADLFRELERLIS